MGTYLFTCHSSLEFETPSMAMRAIISHRPHAADHIVSGSDHRPRFNFHQPGVCCPQCFFVAAPLVKSNDEPANPFNNLLMVNFQLEHSQINACAVDVLKFRMPMCSLETLRFERVSRLAAFSIFKFVKINIEC